MKKILHISNYYPPHVGGIEKLSYQTVSILKDICIQKVICFNSDNKTVIDEVDGIEVVRVGYFTKISSQAISFKYRRILKNVINDFNPDVIHFHYPNPLISLYLLSIRVKAKIVVHWNIEITKQKILKYFTFFNSLKLVKKAKRIYTSSNEMIVSSPFLSRYKEKCDIIPYYYDNNLGVLSVEDEQEIKKIKKKYNGFICLFVGRMVKQKRVDLLIKSFDRIKSDATLLIAGDGPLCDEYKKQVNNPNIVFLGNISFEEYKKYMNAADIFLLSSCEKNESFSLALVDALSLGKPSVTYFIKGSSVNYVNLKGVTGYEVDTYDYISYSRAIEELIQDKEKYEILSKNALLRTKKLFSLDNFNENIKKLLLED